MQREMTAVKEYGYSADKDQVRSAAAKLLWLNQHREMTGEELEEAKSEGTMDDEVADIADSPAFKRMVDAFSEEDFEGAYNVISKDSSLPAVCGRVCPQENQCEKYCVRGIKGEPVGIGRLERFVADWHNENPAPPASPARAIWRRRVTK